MDFLENGSNRSHRERHPSEKIVVNREFLVPFLSLSGWTFPGDKQEEAARRQKLLEANRAERAKRAERKLYKANGVDRPAQDDDERESTSVGFFKKNIFFSLTFF